MAKVLGRSISLPYFYPSFSACYGLLSKARPQSSNAAAPSELSAFYKQLDSLNTLLSNNKSALIRSKADKGFMFVVVEGLDGCGKSSAVNGLAALLRKSRTVSTTRTPPMSLSKVRSYFDNSSEPIQRAFYSAGNYVAAKEILEDSSHQTDASLPPVVICDRYYHSTVSWTAASSDLTDSEISSLEISWPEDLLLPDLVMFLDVSQAERLKRTGGRAGEENIQFEEKLANAQMAERVRTAFAKVQGPQFVTVNGDRGKEEIVQSMYDLLRRHE